MTTASTQPSAAASSSQIRLLSFLTILLQLGLFLVILYLYDLESRAFLHLGIVVFFGFALHYFLPLPLRRTFFAVLSLFCLATVFGFQLEQWTAEGLKQAAWIACLGIGVLGICHSPAPFGVRVFLLLGCGAALSVMRAGLVPSPWSAAIWPVLGSMLMFRTAVYMHALRYDKLRPSLVEGLCYFFMLPNPCFPLFPVVDFQTFRRTYYDAPDRHDIYQSGVSWLFRGATHLILYRLVYHYGVISAIDVATAPQLLQYLLWPFLLYLRVSGQFHIIVGMLHLFGFNLPETHKLYFLSSSFTDFWRRINIYWKDFMMKLFFYPAYVRLQRWSPASALVVSMVLVFTATWLLHAYQWFWIRGSWLLTWNDSLFWLLLAVLVIINALYESAHGRRRTLGAVITPWPQAAMSGVKAAAVFCTIAVLWSFWSAESIQEWLSAFRVLRVGPSSSYVRGLLLFVLLCLAIGIPAALVASNRYRRPFSMTRTAFGVIAGSALIIGAAMPAVLEKLPYRSREIVTKLKQSELNRRDFAKMERGYYENLVEVAQFSPELLDVYRTRPADWVFGLDDEAFERVERPPYFELRPHYTGRALGASFRTNALGMRDKEYSEARPEGVVRIALVGMSFVMGAGVEDEQTFQALLEEHLNADAVSPARRFEVLNFGVGGYTQIQQIGSVENSVLPLSPNVLLFVEHGDVFVPTLKGVVNVVRNGRFRDYEFLVRIAAKANVGQGMDSVLIRQRLKPFEKEILGGIYGRIVDACKARDIPAVWVYLPRPEAFDKGPTKVEADLAREAGFRIVVLEHVYETEDWSSVWLARWDHHPNALGHERIAKHLFKALQEHGIVSLE